MKKFQRPEIGLTEAPTRRPRSVINAATNTVSGTITVGLEPLAVAISETPSGNRAYVTNTSGNTVSVIDSDTNLVIATIPVTRPTAVAFDPTGTRVYVTGGAQSFGELSVIDTATNTVTATTVVGARPSGVATGIVRDDGLVKTFVTNTFGDNVSVLVGGNLATQTITGFQRPFGVAVNPRR